VPSPQALNTEQAVMGSGGSVVMGS